MTTDGRSSGSLTPGEIVRELDKFIVGQHAAKRAVAIAIRNRWRRQHTPERIRDEIMPNNIILIGPTGVGKTEIARRLSRLVRAPFIKVEATKYTEVGYVGRDCESIVRDLTEIAVSMLKSEMSLEVKEKAAALAEERLLDVLLPGQPGSPGVTVPHGGPGAPGIPGPAATVGSPASHGAQPAHDPPAVAPAPADGSTETREKFRRMLRAGELDARTVEVDLPAVQPPAMQVLGPVNLEEMGINVQEMLGNILPKKHRKRRLTVGEARQILTQEETHKLIDAEKAVREAVKRVQESGIVFIDEIDKVAGSRGKSGGGPDVSREGVQRDLLPIVEGTTVLTKYGMVDTTHILFIASGAFHLAKPADLIPELQGRFPIRVELENLTEGDFIEILTKPENALIKQYVELMRTDGVELDFTAGSIREIARTATQVNENVENIGARRLHTIMTTLLEGILFESPESHAGKIAVTEEMVTSRLAGLVRDRDLSRYVL